MRQHNKRGWPAAVALTGAVGLIVSVAAVAGAGSAQAIIGGEDASEEYSFVASLRDGNGQHMCGGALVAPGWVVTAAHCTAMPTEDMSVKVGSNDRTTGGTERGVAKVITHPDYDPEPMALRRDIALLKLDAPVEQEPIRIAEDRAAPSDSVRAMGWGMTCEDGAECPEPPETLQELDTEIVHPDVCTGIEPEGDLCSEHPSQEAQLCTLDSGSPVVRHGPRGWELAGVVSRDGDFDTNPLCVGPSVWTDPVAHSSWIQDTIGPQLPGVRQH